MPRAVAAAVLAALCGACELAGAWAEEKREVAPAILSVRQPPAEQGSETGSGDPGAPAAPADGSEARPFRTLGAALRAAPPGALLEVGEGIWRERISISRPVVLMGRGAGRTRIIPPPDDAGAAVSIEASDAVQIHGISVEGAQICVRISGGSRHQLENVELRDCGETGLFARDAAVVLAATRISEIGQGRSGCGVELEGGSLEARGVSLLHAGRRGFLLHGARAFLSGVEVRESGLSALQALDGAEVRIVGGIFERNAGAALYAGGAKLSVEGARIGGDDFAVIGNRAAEVVVLGGELTDYHTAGVAMVNSEGSVQKAFIAHGGTEGAISITRSGRTSPVLLVDNRIQDPGPMGVHVTESSVTARGNSITGARLDNEKDMGDALYALDSELVIEGNVLRGNAGSGVVALRSHVRLADNAFIANRRAGVLLLDRSRGIATGNLFEQNFLSGIEVGERAFASLTQNRFGGNQRFDIDAGCGRGLSGTAEMGPGNTFATPLRQRSCAPPP